MKKLAIFLAAIAMSVSLSACGSSPDSAHGKSDAEAAITAAVAANTKTQKVNYEWRDTGKIIKKAKKAEADGNFDMAVKLANKAKRQAENAYKQYLDQRNAKPDFS